MLAAAHALSHALPLLHKQIQFAFAHRIGLGFAFVNKTVHVQCMCSACLQATCTDETAGRTPNSASVHVNVR